MRNIEKEESPEAVSYIDVSDLTIEVCSRVEAYPIFRQHSQRMKATRIRTQRGLNKLLNEIKVAIFNLTPANLRASIDFDDVGLCNGREAVLGYLSDEQRQQYLELVSQEILVELLLRTREDKECYCCTVYRMAQELEMVMKDILINHTEEGRPTVVSADELGLQNQNIGYN